MRNLFIIIAILAVLGIGYFVFIGNKNNNSSSSSNNNDKTASESADNCPDAPEATETTTITYSSSGFSPEIVSLKSGGKLTIKNESGSSLEFDSDPHPVHTSNSELNVGSIEDGSEKTVTLETTGCFGYHNHLASSDGGKILIK